jgi:hypothetical protein
MDMTFFLIMNDSPTRDNKNHWRKNKDWKKVKDDWVKIIRQELGLSNAEAKAILITRRECDLTTGWSKISGVTTPSVGVKIHNKII